MNYHIITENGYIKRIELSNYIGGQSITKAEYNEIMSVIQSCPNEDGKGYKLRTDLTWEEYDLPPEPDPGDEEATAEDLARALEEIL